MSLTITVQYPGRPNKYMEDISVSFDNEVIFWEIWPWLNEFNVDHHEGIDLYSVYDIDSSKTLFLKTYLEKALPVIQAKPEVITVLLGWKGPGESNPIYQDVKRTEVLSTLNKFISICDYAIVQHGRISILGD